MKKYYSVLFFALLIISANQLFAQEAPRYKIQMSIEANGKTATAELSSINYTINRSLPDTVSDTKKDKGKSKPVVSYTATNDFYFSFTLNKVDKNLLNLLSDKKNTCNGSVVITDTYGKEDARKFEFKNASLSSLSENVSVYSNGGYGSAGSLAISVKELIIDGIVFTP